MDAKSEDVKLIQAMIEVMGKVVYKVDVMAQLVGRVIEDVIDKIHKPKLLELLYPYLQLVFTESTLTQHRSICILLLHLIKCCRHYEYRFIRPIHSSVFTYLARTFTSTSDQWTQLFVLIALGDLKMSETEKREIEGCEQIGQMVETCRETFEGKDVGQLIKSGDKHRLLYQINLCSQNFRKSLSSNSTNVNSSSQATLNPHDRTPHLTLSACHLSARSDWHWQSVRSVCQVSAHIYYFEVVLLTAGPMTIGWATKRTDLHKITKIHPKGTTQIVVGFDEFSIGFDGFNRCIYHDNKTFKLENIPRWKSGDIVGCLIDMSQKRFNFYLNGIQINYIPHSTIYFSSQPYNSLLSLSQFQQVYLNFGQFPFSSHRPKYIDFCDFYSNKEEEVLENHGNTIVHFNNSIMSRNVISIDSNVQQEDLFITGNDSNSKRSVESVANPTKLQPNEPKPTNPCSICTQPQASFRYISCDHFNLCVTCVKQFVFPHCPRCPAL